LQVRIGAERRSQVRECRQEIVPGGEVVSRTSSAQGTAILPVLVEGQQNPLHQGVCLRQEEI